MRAANARVTFHFIMEPTNIFDDVVPLLDNGCFRHNLILYPVLDEYSDRPCHTSKMKDRGVLTSTVASAMPSRALRQHRDDFGGRIVEDAAGNA